jgi:hypothetical protein
MTPTDFEFTVTMPGDARLVGAVKQLAAQAAGYAQLTAEDGQGLATQVERATEAAIASSAVAHHLIQVRFAADRHAIDVVISTDAGSSAAAPASSASDGLTVDWTTEGSRRTCHIRRLLSA